MRSPWATTSGGRWARASAAPGRSARSVMLLCGGATAVAGPIAFVGLAVPHAARAIAGPDHRWLLAYSVVLAPILLVGADIIGRLVVRPAELRSASSPRSSARRCSSRSCAAADRPAVTALARPASAPTRPRARCASRAAPAVVCAALLVATLAVARRRGRHRRLPAPRPATCWRRWPARRPRPTSSSGPARAARAHGAARRRRVRVAGAIFQSVSRNPLGSPDIDRLHHRLGHRRADPDPGARRHRAGRARRRRAAAWSPRSPCTCCDAPRRAGLPAGPGRHRRHAVLESVNSYLITRATREDAFAARALAGRQPQRPRLGPGVAGRPALARDRAAGARARAPARAARDGRRRRPCARRPGRALAPRSIFAAVALTRRRHRVRRPDRVRRARRAAARTPAHRSAAPGLLPPRLMGGLLLAASDLVAQRLLERRPSGRRRHRRARRRLPRLAAVQRRRSRT